MTDTLSFSDFLRRELGTSRWCVSPRLTQRLREKGYEAAVSQKRMNFLQEQ
jgi:biotin operon repressor